MANSPRILLGGLGDDAHSVGITLLKWFFSNAGFRVSFLGIQNTLDDFFTHAADHEIIFISSLNGHAELYLSKFQSKLSELNDNHRRLWYLGGNLSVSKPNDTVIKQFMDMGFTRVFPKPVTLHT
jgi:methylaspartate mutase epsilon subunit